MKDRLQKLLSVLFVSLVFNYINLYKRVSRPENARSAQGEELGVQPPLRNQAITEPIGSLDGSVAELSKESLPGSSAASPTLNSTLNSTNDPEPPKQPKPKRRGKENFQDYNEKAIKSLKVPAPIILLGFPKAGTTTIDHYFRCNSLHVSHEECYDNPDKKGKTRNCGQRMMENLEHGRPIFHRTGDYHVYTGIFHSTTCIFPQLTHLEEMHENHPNATFLLHMRDLDKWVDSTRRWSRHMRYGTMYTQMADCFVENPPDRENQTLVDSVLKNKYQKVIDGARKLVQEHPSHRLIEVHVDRDDAEDIMDASFFHSPRENCWSHENVNTGKRRKRRKRKRIQ